MGLRFTAQPTGVSLCTPTFLFLHPKIFKYPKLVLTFYLEKGTCIFCIMDYETHKHITDS